MEGWYCVKEVFGPAISSLTSADVTRGFPTVEVKSTATTFTV